MKHYNYNSEEVLTKIIWDVAQDIAVKDNRLFV